MNLKIQREDRIGLPFGVKFFIFFLILVALLNNLRVSEQTKNRDNISATWEALVKNSEFFNDVHDKDLFISTTYNDAYQINVADFYLNTGKRLAAFVWPNYIWPFFDECKNFSTCPLENGVEKINDWLVNISKNDSKLRMLSKEWKFTNDWPSYIHNSGALRKSNFWYFNIYMLTNEVGLAYLIPVIKNESNLLIDVSYTKFFMVSLNQETRIRPLLGDRCFVSIYDKQKIDTSYGSVYTSTFTMTPNVPKLKPLDLREMTIGTC